MPRFLWHFDADGCPLECIVRQTGQHVPVFICGPDEWSGHQDGERPIACSIPKVSGVEGALVVNETLIGIRCSSSDQSGESP